MMEDLQYEFSTEQEWPPNEQYHIIRQWPFSSDATLRMGS